jgi:hypothetical protein
MRWIRAAVAITARPPPMIATSHSIGDFNEAVNGVILSGFFYRRRPKMAPSL